MSRTLTQNDAARTPAATQVFDALERLETLESDNARLRELVQHCSAYWAYSHCGYQHMDSPQRALYDDVIGRTARSQRALHAAAAGTASQWRHCEFCGCDTNAAERVCCHEGHVADRTRWDRSTLAA
jgi:hypothetical protein